VSGGAPGAADLSRTRPRVGVTSHKSVSPTCETHYLKEPNKVSHLAKRVALWTWSRFCHCGENMCKENDADEARNPAADTSRKGQRIVGRGLKRPIAVHLISALFTGLVGFAAGSLGILNAYCALSPSGCPTEQVANLKVEAPVPWEVDFADWRVEAQANKDCPVVSEPPTGPPFGVRSHSKWRRGGLSGRRCMWKGMPCMQKPTNRRGSRRSS